MRTPYYSDGQKSCTFFRAPLGKGGQFEYYPGSGNFSQNQPGPKLARGAQKKNSRKIVQDFGPSLYFR